MHVTVKGVWSVYVLFMTPVVKFFFFCYFVYYESIKRELKANPTVRGIQQCSKQSFQTHHPGVSETPSPRLFFYKTNLLGKCYISV